MKSVLLLFHYTKDARYCSSEFSYKKELLNLLISFIWECYCFEITDL